MLIVFITVPSIEIGKKISRILVEDKLAACVSIVNNVSSVFCWKGKIEEVEEFLLIAKTTDSKKQDLIHKVNELHPYECPEIVFTAIAGGSESYLNWIKDSVIVQ